MKWRPIGVLLTTFTLLTLRPVAKIAAADQDGTPQAAADITELRDRVSKILDREGVAGAAIGIAARDRVIWVDGIGLADVQQQRPVDADTPFRLGSISKNVTALAIMQQVERGNLSLDMRLRDAAPEVPYANAWESTRPVKLADLLEHTAGFDLYRFNDDADYGATARPLISMTSYVTRSLVRWACAARTFATAPYSMAVWHRGIQRRGGRSRTSRICNAPPPT